MRLSWRDAAATVVTGAAVALYLAFRQDSFLPGLASPRGVGAVVFGLGMVACTMATPAAAGRSAWSAVAAALGFAALFAAGWTVITGNTTTLAVLVGAIVCLWAASTAHHAVGGGRTTRPAPPGGSSGPPLAIG